MYIKMSPMSIEHRYTFKIYIDLQTACRVGHSVCAQNCYLAPNKYKLPCIVRQYGGRHFSSTCVEHCAAIEPKRISIHRHNHKSLQMVTDMCVCVCVCVWGGGG